MNASFPLFAARRQHAMAPRRSRDDSDDSDGSGDEVDVDGDENERDAVEYDERGRRILADDIVAAIHQAHARGLTAPMLPPKRQMNQHRASVTWHRPGYSSVDARDGCFHPSNGDPNPRGAAEGSSKDAAASAATSSSAAFSDPAKGWGGLGDFSDAVLNALAAKRLDKDKMTHGQRLEARLEARMRGGSVPRGDRGGTKQDKQRRGSGESFGGFHGDFHDGYPADSGEYPTNNVSDDPTLGDSPSSGACSRSKGRGRCRWSARVAERAGWG